jgi:hypothetical protein
LIEKTDNHFLADASVHTSTCEFRSFGQQSGNVDRSLIAHRCDECFESGLHSNIRTARFATGREITVNSLLVVSL